MKLFAISLTLMIILVIAVLAWSRPRETGLGSRVSAASIGKKPDALPEAEHHKLHARAAEAQSYAREHSFNKDICFLVDMSLASGSNRFFIYDLRGDSVQDLGLVTHGRCNQDWLAGRQYGNTVGCGCSSLGKYRIGNAYNGRFGLAYKLHGLELTNDKAFDRYVVLHSHDCVPATATTEDICQSDGCPTVSPPFLKILATHLDHSAKPVLLWIFE